MLSKGGTMKNKITRSIIVFVLICVTAVTLMSFCACQNDDDTQPSNGPNIRYYYINSEGVMVETADSSEFVREIGPSEKIDSIYVLNYKPYDIDLSKYTDMNGTKADVDNIKQGFYANAKEYYTFKNQEFLSSIGVNEDSQDYKVVVSYYSPYICISYEDKYLFQKYESQFIGKAKSNSGVCAIHVTVQMVNGPDCDD